MYVYVSQKHIFTDKKTRMKTSKAYMNKTKTHILFRYQSVGTETRFNKNKSHIY